MKHLDKNLLKIIENYKNDLQNFITENQLDSEFIKDIEERIFEKIEQLENPNRKNILSILSEIGTPEEIFADEISENSLIAKNGNSEKPKNFFQRIREKTWWMIFLGVFKTLAEILNIPVFWIRILACFLVLILIPATHGFILPAFFFLYFLVFLILKTRIFSFFFFLGLAIFFGMLLFGASVICVAFFGDFHYANMYIFHELSPVFPIGITIGTISLFILFLYFSAKIFRKNLSVYFLLSGVILLIIGISCGVVFVADMAMKYSREEIVRENFSLPAQKDKILRFHIRPWGSSDVFGFGMGNNTMFYTRAEPSLSENIEISLVTEHRGSDKIIEKSKQFIQNVEFYFDESNNLTSKFELNTNEKFPWLLIRSDVDVVKIPVWQKFSIFSPHHHHEPVLVKNYEKYSFSDIMRISRECRVYFYDENKNLNCDLSYEEIENILSEKNLYLYTTYELENFVKMCEWENKNRGMNFQCDFLESEKKRNVEYCEKNTKTDYYSLRPCQGWN